MDKVCRISVTATGKYRISFYTPSEFFCVVPRDPFLEHDLRQEQLEKAFSKLDDERDYDHEALVRAKKQVIDYGQNNPWTFFLTITFDKRKINREDCALLYKQIKQAFKNYKQRYCSEFRYVALPEWHKDETHLHWHGIVYIPSWENMEDISRHYDRKKHCYYYRSAYMFRKFGSMRLDPFYESVDAASCYITKYITKQNMDIFKVRYICSKGLKTSETVFEFTQREDVAEVLKRLTTSVMPFTGEILLPVTENKYNTSYALDSTQFAILFPDLVD